MIWLLKTERDRLLNFLHKMQQSHYRTPDIDGRRIYILVIHEVKQVLYGKYFERIEWWNS